MATKARFASSERHDVTHRGKRHEIEQAKQVRLRPVPIVAFAAKRARGGDKKQKHDARRGEMSLAGEIVLPVRIDHGKRGRQRLVGLVVVDDDHLRAGRISSGDCHLGGGAAIDGENEARAGLGKAGQRVRAWAIALRQPVGDIGRGRLPMRPQEALNQRHGRRTVDVVVAEHGDRLVFPDGAGEALSRFLHVLQARGIGQQRLQRGIEKAGHGLHIGAARGEHAAEQLGQAMRLGNGGGGHGATRIEPLGPAEAARGAFHAEQRRGVRVLSV